MTRSLPWVARPFTARSSAGGSDGSDVRGQKGGGGPGGSRRDSAARAAESGTIVGYRLHASDGDIGKVDEASNAVDESSIVVDTGGWVFGSKVILLSGTIHRVGDAERKVCIDVTKERIKNSPEADETASDHSAHREGLGTYYGESYR